LISLGKQNNMRSRNLTLHLGEGRRYGVLKYQRIRLLTNADSHLICEPTQPMSSEAWSSNNHESIQFRTANGRSDLQGAFKLLQKCYCDAGLAVPDHGPLRVLPFHLWQQTQVFVAVRKEKIIGCVTLIADTSWNALPIDSTYPKALSQFRRQGERIGEIACLAIAPSGSRTSTKIFVELTRRLTVFARDIGLTQLAAVVHPRHATFYRHAMGFEIIGPLARQSHVEGRPGLPIRGLINDPTLVRDRWRDAYFDESIPRTEIKPRPISEVDQDYLRQYIQSEPKILKAA
jgi:hypothetical protein